MICFNDWFQHFSGLIMSPKVCVYTGHVYKMIQSDTQLSSTGSHQAKQVHLLLNTNPNVRPYLGKKKKRQQQPQKSLVFDKFSVLPSDCGNETNLL